MLKKAAVKVKAPGREAEPAVVPGPVQAQAAVVDMAAGTVQVPAVGQARAAV